MVARVVFETSALTLVRATGIGVAAFVGAWDVVRLLSAGDQSPTLVDLATCPIVPVMRIFAAYINISDIALQWCLFLGNTATYAAAAFLIFRLLERRLSGSEFPELR
jgi:hypothetical protein